MNSFQVRHGPSFYDCIFTLEPGEDGHEDVAVVQLSEDDQGLAAGQFTAFYQGRSCIGSGVILESWDDQDFPVCARALEIAKMEDKSKIGKPVKIKVKSDTPPKECCEIDDGLGRGLLANSPAAVSHERRGTSELSMQREVAADAIEAH